MQNCGTKRNAPNDNFHPWKTENVLSGRAVRTNRFFKTQTHRHTHTLWHTQTLLTNLFMKIKRRFHSKNGTDLNVQSWKSQHDKMYDCMCLNATMKNNVCN